MFLCLQTPELGAAAPVDQEGKRLNIVVSFDTTITGLGARNIVVSIETAVCTLGSLNIVVSVETAVYRLGSLNIVVSVETAVYRLGSLNIAVSVETAVYRLGMLNIATNGYEVLSEQNYNGNIVSLCVYVANDAPPQKN